jgi:hypothetical protein
VAIAEIGDVDGADHQPLDQRHADGMQHVHVVSGRLIDGDGLAAGVAGGAAMLVADPEITVTPLPGGAPVSLVDPAKNYLTEPPTLRLLLPGHAGGPGRGAGRLCVLPRPLPVPVRQGAGPGGRGRGELRRR